MKKDKEEEGPITKTCKDMCQCLIEMLIKIEEAKMKDEGKAKVTARKESCLLAMLLIGRANPALIETHIGTLVPILEQAVEAATKSISTALSAAERAAAQNERVRNNLVRILFAGE